MSHWGGFWLSPWLPTLQFSMRSMLVLTIVTCVNIAILVAWPAFGWLIVMPVAGMWITSLAIAGQFRFLAYLAAAWTSGIAWYLAASFPLSPLGMVFGWSFPDVRAAIAFSLASVISALVMRYWIVSSDDDFPLAQALALSLLTGIAFSWIIMIGPIFEPAHRITEQPMGMFWAVAFVVLSIYVVLPAALLVVYFLRDADSVAVGLFHIEYDVLVAVEKLELKSERPVTADDIADEAGYDVSLAQVYLDRLHQAGKIQHTTADGYSIAEDQLS
jgi:hypothetical protein